MGFAKELREKYNLTEETKDEQQELDKQHHISRLMNYLEVMASRGRVEFSIFFQTAREPKWGETIKYPPPANSLVLPTNLKTDTVNYLTSEGFHIKVWAEHIAINLAKEP